MGNTCNRHIRQEAECYEGASCLLGLSQSLSLPDFPEFCDESLAGSGQSVVMSVGGKGGHLDC